MDDLISRRSAIDALEKEKPTPFVNKDGSVDPFGAGRQNQWYRDGMAIMNLPSAQPERKKGKWIYNSPVTMKCNQCGLVIKDWDWHRFKYCPNCDADMRGEQE